MEKLSVVIITCNEAENIARCLQSVQSVADEIVVVDSLSTDTTEEICKQFNVTFVSQPWLGYSEQKNFANNLASNNFVLSIDADEALSPELAEDIVREKNAGFPFSAYECNRLNFFCGTPMYHSGWNNDHRIRLWNKQLAKWQGNVHELLNFEQDITPKMLVGNLLHYSISSMEQYTAMTLKYARLAAREKFERGKTSSIFKIALLPPLRFLQKYVFQLGFLDGLNGFVVCKTTAYGIFVRYYELYILQKNSR